MAHRTSASKTMESGVWQTALARPKLWNLVCVAGLRGRESSWTSGRSRRCLGRGRSLNRGRPPTCESPTLQRLSMRVSHKVLTYIEYSAVSGVFRTIDPPPPSPPSDCVLTPAPKAPKAGGGGTHSPGSKGVGGQHF